MISSKQNALVLLDLIGADNPMFYNSFRETNDLFERMQLIGMYFVFQISSLSLLYSKFFVSHYVPVILLTILFCGQDLTVLCVEFD